jgi:hypothetical protein
MPEQSISCPKCGTEIPLTEALSHQIAEQLRGEFEQKLEHEKVQLWKTAQVKAQEKMAIELADLKSQNEEHSKELEEARKNEIELRRKTREIEEKEKSLELEMERKMDEEKERLSQAIRKSTEEESRMKMLEKDKQLEQMRSTIEELKRKSEQGSMQIQGDVQENDLRDTLRAKFFTDTIEDVPTGIRGADLVQTVRNAFGQECGVLLWESKNTKAWSNDWIKKLKGDQGLAKADVCILVSKTLPEGIEAFGSLDGVWVCGYETALDLAEVLRLSLAEVYAIKQANSGKGEKMEALYGYLTGSQFKNRVENIVMAFTSMKSDLEAEKRSFQKMWSKREKEIERVIGNTSGMYGDLQGIAGANALPRVESLELPDGLDDEADGHFENNINVT